MDCASSGVCGSHKNMYNKSNPALWGVAHIKLPQCRANHKHTTVVWCPIHCKASPSVGLKISHFWHSHYQIRPPAIPSPPTHRPRILVPYVPHIPHYLLITSATLPLCHWQGHGLCYSTFTNLCHISVQYHVLWHNLALCHSLVFQQLVPYHPSMSCLVPILPPPHDLFSCSTPLVGTGFNCT